MTPPHLPSAHRSDSMEKPAAMEPPDLPPLDIDDLPSKAHDSAPLSVNDQVRLDFGRDGKPGIPSPDKNYSTHRWTPSPHPATNSYKL